MYLARRNLYLNVINMSVRFFSAKQNHYEVLNLKKNCTDKDIKQAFIRMSKEYHPDVNKETKAQEKFVRLVEAYNVLGKPGSRAAYDNKIYSHGQASPYVYKSYNVRNNAAYSSFYNARTQHTSNAEQQRSRTSNSYYGFEGIKKLPNYYIIAVCVGVAFFGVMIQLVVLRNVYFTQRAKAREKSMLLAEELNRVRNAAKDNGNELQTRLLLEKIVSAANPTVTTASIGQALASEKK